MISSSKTNNCHKLSLIYPVPLEFWGFSQFGNREGRRRTSVSPAKMDWVTSDSMSCGSPFNQCQRGYTASVVPMVHVGCFRHIGYCHSPQLWVGGYAGMKT